MRSEKWVQHIAAPRARVRRVKTPFWVGASLHRHTRAVGEHMTERRSADAADFDPERKWSKGSRTFDCSCGHTFVLASSRPGDLEGATPLEEPA